MKSRHAAGHKTRTDYRSHREESPLSERSALMLTTRPARIFISYRHEDASWPVRWLTDKLTDHFGTGVVFQDVDSIRPGDDFAAEIEAAVGGCSVLLAVIGPRWLAAQDGGGRRIENPRDWVRLEIETAITRQVRVIPVLVDEATLPDASELPKSLQKLSRQTGCRAESRQP